MRFNCIIGASGAWRPSDVRTTEPCFPISPCRPPQRKLASLSEHSNVKIKCLLCLVLDGSPWARPLSVHIRKMGPMASPSHGWYERQKRATSIWGIYKTVCFYCSGAGADSIGKMCCFVGCGGLHGALGDFGAFLARPHSPQSRLCTHSGLWHDSSVTGGEPLFSVGLPGPPAGRSGGGSGVCVKGVTADLLELLCCSFAFSGELRVY